MTRRHLESAALPAALFAVALVVRSMQHHAALLYPDGYQYLLMARGIGEHLRPTTVLGPGGDAFVPSADAAVKPFFPLVVAGVHALGAPWLDAARLVTVVSGAWAVTAAALLVTRLGGSRAAGLAAGALVLTSPSIGFWSGSRAPTRSPWRSSSAPRWRSRTGTPASAGRSSGWPSRRDPRSRSSPSRQGSSRSEARRAGGSSRGRSGGGRRRRARVRAPEDTGLGHRLEARVARPVFAAGIGLVLAVPAGWLRYAAVAAAGLVVLAVAVEPGPLALWHADWPLLLAGAAGLVVLLDRRRDNDAAALTVVAIVLLLGSVYLVKNPGLVRYFSLLLPAAALLAGLALSALSPRERAAALPAIAIAAAIGWFQPIPGNRDFDMFPMVARGIANTLATTHPQPLVTAAPDAYGFWLPASLSTACTRALAAPCFSTRRSGCTSLG